MNGSDVVDPRVIEHLEGWFRGIEPGSDPAVIQNLAEMFSAIDKEKAGHISRIRFRGLSK